MACFSVYPCSQLEKTEVLSATQSCLTLSCCPRTPVRLIAVSVHSKILAISLSALAKHVLSICPWNQWSPGEVIKAVSCRMNCIQLFFVLQGTIPPFLPVTTEHLPCNFLCLHSFVFLQTIFETLYPVTSGKGMGTAHTFIGALWSGSDKLVYFYAEQRGWGWGKGVWLAQSSFCHCIS